MFRVNPGCKPQTAMPKQYKAPIVVVFTVFSIIPISYPYLPLVIIISTTRSLGFSSVPSVRQRQRIQGFHTVAGGNLALLEIPKVL